MPNADHIRPEYNIQSVANAMAVLAVFEAPPHEFGATEVARRLGVNKNLAFRLLKTLEAGGFLQQVGNRYEIGLRMLDIGRLWPRRRQVLRSAAHPLMLDIRSRVQGQVFLVVAEGLDGVILELVAGTPWALEVGARIPLHAGSPKALLAFLPEDFREAYIERGLARYTHNTLIAPADLRRELELIRHQGFSVANEEFRYGSDAVGVPVRDHTSHVIAVLGVTAPSDQLRPRLKEYLALMIPAGELLSGKLGYGGQPLPSAAFAR